MKNKISKILIVFSLLFIALGTNNPVLADTNCSWTPTSDGSGSCPTNLVYSTAGCAGKRGLTEICCCKKAVTFSSISSSTSAKFNLPDYVFQIPIGNLSKLTAIDCSQSSTCEIPWISQYIAAVYNYGLSIGGIIAVLILMAAGLLWIVSGGDSNKINQAKKMIIGSVTGLFLFIGMYVFLGFINPDLQKLKNISMSTITRLDMDDENWEGAPSFQSSAKYCGCVNWKDLYQSSTYKNGAAIKAQLGNSPLAPYSDLIAQLSQENKIDPAMILAIWRQDSSYGTAGAGKTNKNPGNVRCGSAKSGPGWVCATNSKSGAFRKYDDYGTAIKDWYNVVGKGKRLSTAKTIRALIKTYAPPTDNNNTQAYINFVMNFIDKAHNGQLRASDGNASALQKCSSINDGC